MGLLPSTCDIKLIGAYVFGLLYIHEYFVLDYVIE